MIDPAILGSAGPIVLGIGVGLIGRRALKIADRRRSRRRRVSHPAPRPSRVGAPQ